jgi:hypothetical protein
MELARDLLALDVLERHRSLGEAPLVLDRLAERCRKMVELGADRGELRCAARRDARLIAPVFELGHHIRKGLERRQCPADHIHHHQKQRQRDHRADLELGHDGVPDLGDLVIGMGGDQQRTRLAMDRDGYAHRGLLGMDQADEPGRRRAGVVVGVGPGLRQRTARFVPKRNADMAQAAEVACDLVQPGVRIGRLVEIRHDHFDEFAREPDHALVLGLHARPGFRDLAADIDGESQRQQQRQQQVDAPAQG